MYIEIKSLVKRFRDVWVLKNKKVLLNELERALLNKGMLLGGIISGVIVYLYYKNTLRVWMPQNTPEGFYEGFAVGGIVDSWFIINPSVYMYYLYYMFPFIVVLPYGMSFLNDVRTGIIKNILLRMKRKTYATYKFIATFISGGIAAVIPLLVSLVILFNLGDINNTTSVSRTFTRVSWFEVLYYTHPVLYVVLYSLIYFMLGGILATLSMLVATISRNRLTVFLTPFLTMWLILFIQQRLLIMGVSNTIMRFFPYSFMFAYNAMDGKEWIIAGVIIIAIVEYLIFRHRICKREVM